MEDLVPSNHKAAHTTAVWSDVRTGGADFVPRDSSSAFAAFYRSTALKSAWLYLMPVLIII